MSRSSTTPDRTNTAARAGGEGVVSAEPTVAILVFTEKAGTPLFYDKGLTRWRKPIGKRLDLTWFELTTLLVRKITTCDLARFPDIEIAKRANGGWAAGAYRGNHRNGGAFVETQIMTFDADAGGSVERLRQILDGVRALIHSTAKSNTDDPRARIVIMLAAPCRSLADYRRAHARIGTWLESQIPGLKIDPAATDGPRLCFFPMHRPETALSMAVTGGGPLDLTPFLRAPTAKPATPNRSPKVMGNGYSGAALRRERDAVASGHETMRRAAWALSRPELGLTANDVRGALLPNYHDTRDGEALIRGAFEKRGRL